MLFSEWVSSKLDSDFKDDFMSSTVDHLRGGGGAKATIGLQKVITKTTYFTRLRQNHVHFRVRQLISKFTTVISVDYTVNVMIYL